MLARNRFFDVRLGIGARNNCDFMIGCTYKSEKTLEDYITCLRYVRYFFNLIKILRIKLKFNNSFLTNYFFEK